MFELTGKVAIVTGAAGGLGQGIAVAFAKQGACVVPTDRAGVPMDETAEKCEKAGAPKVLPVAMDVTDQESIRSAVETVRTQCGRIDILANNAGMNRPMPAEEVTPEIWDAHFAVNIKGGFFTAQAVAPVMKAQHFGRVIFTGSQAGIVARENQQPYCATKGGIQSLVRALAYDWAKDGITVNAVAPTFAMTELARKRLEDPDYAKMVLGMIPVGRLVDPGEIGSAFAYLASDEAAMVTGQTLVIDGGWTIW
ncbi:MAG: SDR family oxidoreductase [Oscillospiraceae bacterium]|nr:SDR family oxidoreductase [Oscillospiraceae bacterium]